MAETWLDIMPSIPLARAVPVVWLNDNGVTTDIVRLTTSDGVAWGMTGAELPADNWRVDLADPQGFAYAFRWAENTAAAADRHLPHRVWQQFAGCWLDDMDAPMLVALAKLCVEVAG